MGEKGRLGGGGVVDADMVPCGHAITIAEAPHTLLNNEAHASA